MRKLIFILSLIPSIVFSQTTTVVYDSTIIPLQNGEVIRYTTPRVYAAWSNLDSLRGRSTATKAATLVSPLDLPLSTAIINALALKQNSLGFTPYNSTNPNGYISSITSQNVVTALGYTPYNGAINPNGYLVAVDIAGKQNTLVSGTSIKTINGGSVLGSGDLVVSGAPVFYYGSDAGANDSYAVTIAGIASYTNGMIITFRANTANTTGCTLNVNGLGAIAIVKRATTTPASNDIIAGMICMVVYNGNNQFTLINPVVN